MRQEMRQETWHRHEESGLERYRHKMIPLWHGFFSGKGNLSCASHALGLENTSRACDTLRTGAISSLQLLRQIHSTQVKTLDKDNHIGIRTEAGDGMIYDTEGDSKTKTILLGVVTADCVPIFAVDIERGMLGVLHTGWRGLQDKDAPSLIDNFISAWQRRSYKTLSSLRIVIGPCIQAASYVVGEELLTYFSVYSRQFFQESGGTFYFDLARCARGQFLKHGVLKENTILSPIDTFASSNNFYSYRSRKDDSRNLSLLSNVRLY